MTYYDPNHPYTIKNWNSLVRAINDILENPPEGSACEAIHDLLSTVMDPHKWSLQDIQDAREKLSETCGSIQFSQPLKLWHQPTVDELIAAMNEAWCDCDCESSHSLIWQATGAIADRNYTQQWVELSILVGSGTIGAENQTYRIQDFDLFNGWTRLMFEGSLDEEGTIGGTSVLFPVEQPVIYVPRWIIPDSPSWHNIVDNSEDKHWVGEVTNKYYLDLVCGDSAE